MNKRNNTLYLIKMGCEFPENDEITKISDLNNYRYFTHNIELKTGEILDTLEISHGARYNFGKNGYKYVDDFGLWFNTYYKDENGCEWTMLDLNKQLNKGNYYHDNLFNGITVLKLINSISKIQYTNIKIVDRRS